MSTFRRVFLTTGASLLMAGLAHAGIELDIGGAKVPATSLTFSVSNQPVYDPETYVPVTPAQTTLSVGSIYITRDFDGSSSKILKSVIANDKVPSLEIVMTKDGTPGRQVWRLEDAVMNNYSTYTGEESQVIENFDITYSKATLMVYTGASATPDDTVTWATPVPAQ